MSSSLFVGAIVLALVAGSPFVSAGDVVLRQSQDSSNTGATAGRACKLLSASFPGLVSFPGKFF